MASSNEYSKDHGMYDPRDAADNRLEHGRELQRTIAYVLKIQSLLVQEVKSFISRLSADAIFDTLNELDQFKIESKEIENAAKSLQLRLQGDMNENKQGLRNTYLENEIQLLRKNTDQLKLRLEKLNNYEENKDFENVSPNGIDHLRSADVTSRTGMAQSADDTSALSSLLLRLISPSIYDLDEHEDYRSETESGMNLEEGEETMVVVDSETTPKISREIHLSNNIVNWLRGPLKSIVSGSLHMVEMCALKTYISEAVRKAAKQASDKEQTMNNSFKSAFTEITSDWTFEGKNSNEGLSSASIWMRDPEDRRILVKTQDHPLAAANEWLGYILGRVLGLPTNEVQIAIYENKLATLHTDMTGEGEKTITLVDLPKELRKKLMTHPIMAQMDLFDHITQNVDRNPGNILITIPKTTDINDDITKFKIHLIDHASCFGLGKFNGISVVAFKLHSQHLAVAKFDTREKAKQFQQYLSKVPGSDRILIGKTLNRFAAITSDQIGAWITQVQYLLSSSQYNRIHNVLYRQRDIARRYTIQWGITPRFCTRKQAKGLDLCPNE